MEDYIKDLATKLCYSGKLDNRITYEETKSIIETTLTDYALKRNEELVSFSEYVCDEEESILEWTTPIELVSDFLKKK